VLLLTGGVPRDSVVRDLCKAVVLSVKSRFPRQNKVLPSDAVHDALSRFIPSVARQQMVASGLCRYILGP
jgi:hypothetical protein